MSAPPPKLPHTDHVKELSRFLTAFTAGAGGSLVVELRALGVPQKYGAPAVECGFFDLTPDQKPFLFVVGGWLARDAQSQPEGVYVTLNPVNDALLARAHNRIKPPSKKAISANDKDVSCRCWLLIDVDPTRPSGISATDEEKAAAREVLEAVRKDLRDRGWPEPMVVDSGNGFHLWYRINLPADDGGLIERTLKALASIHDTPAAKLDTSVYNPSRIVKLPGTWARKGDSIQSRPHRLARVLEVPDVIAVTPAALLEQVAPTAERKSSTSSPITPSNGQYDSRLLVARWLDDRGIAYRLKDKPDGIDRTVYVLKTCPFDASHSDPDSCVMQAADGKLSAKCLHASCQGRGWKEFKSRIGHPDANHYDPPLAQRPREANSRPIPRCDATVASSSLPAAPPATPTSNGGESATGVAIILGYFRDRYRPTFRRGNSIHSHDGEMIPKKRCVRRPNFPTHR